MLDYELKMFFGSNKNVREFIHITFQEKKKNAKTKILDLFVYANL